MTERLADLSRTEKLELMVDSYLQDVHYDLSQIDMKFYVREDESGFRSLMAAFMRASFAIGITTGCKDPENIKEQFRGLGYKFD